MLTFTFNKTICCWRFSRLGAAIGCVLLAALALAGCGGSGSRSVAAHTVGNGSGAAGPSTQTSGTTAASPAKVPEVNLALTSLVLREGSPIPGRYTCDGADTPPPLRWGNVPVGTVELILEIFEIDPGSTSSESFFDWAVAGVKPMLHGIVAGGVPRGAVVGRNGFGQAGYSICPPKGSLQRYGIVVYALPSRLGATPGFDPGALRTRAERTAKFEGLLGFYYKRP